MDDNPYAPPGDAISLGRLSRRVDPKEVPAIKRRLENLSYGSQVFGPLGFVFEGCAPILVPYSPTWGIFLWATGKLCYLAGISFAAMAKGRHWIWGGLGWFSCFGYLGIWLLGKRCLHCGEATNDDTCAVCGAPAPT